ncbi:MAG: winged helix-turn-helix domain-containing protein [Candidatus Nanoarchaeia archaeon]|nr:winged helix-turn-helix domain-containing protein [Candidatus Nanoarchaeia archaeon]
MTDKYIMVSLEDKKAEELANVISNKTSRKIIDFLSENKASEAEIAKKLSLPASTVNYNIKALMKSNLIEAVDFTWSEKGNKINFYKVSNKTIIISPKNTGITALRQFLPVVLISGFASLLVYIYTKTYQIIQPAVMEEKAMYAADASLAGARENFIQQSTYLLNPGSWFFIGAVFALLIFFLIKTWRSEK